MLQRKTIKELTRVARQAKAEMESYLEDLGMYSKPEFWEAINEAETGKVNTYKSIREYMSKMARK